MVPQVRCAKDSNSTGLVLGFAPQVAASHSVLVARPLYEQRPPTPQLAVKQAARWFKGAFFVCNGDVVSCLDLEAMARSHRERGAAMSIFLAPVSDPSSYGVAEIDAG